MLEGMIFLERRVVAADGTLTVEIAAVEYEQNAARYEAQGYRRCSYAEFQAGWRQRDAGLLAERRALSLAAAAQPHERAADRTARAARTYPRS